MLQARSGDRPALTASRVTQSMPEHHEVVGVAVVGADADPFVGGAKLGDRLDRLGQAVPRRRGVAAAQEHPDAGLDEIIGDLAVDAFMGVGDAARSVGGDEFAAVDMTRHRLPARKRGGEDGMAPFVAFGDLDEIHLLAEAHRFRPAVEEAGDLLGGEVAARRLQHPETWRERCSARSGRSRAALRGHLRASSRHRPHRARCRSRGCRRRWWWCR